MNMRRLLLHLFPAVFLAWAIPAWAILDGPLSLYTSSYKGPGDIVKSAVFWWGLRGYSAAYSTGLNNAATIRRASDNATTNIRILKNGKFDTATATAFCASTTCYITVLFDQASGKYNVSQASTSVQPQLSFSCTVVPVCISFSGTQLLYNAAAFPGQAQPFSMSSVVNTATGSGTEAWWGGTGCALYFSTGRIELYCGTASNVIISINAWYSFVVEANTLSSVYNINNSETTTSIGANNLSAGQISLGGDGSGNEKFNGYLEEVGLWNGAFSITQRQKMTTNNRNYWGF